MSYILEALRKAEAERGRGTVPDLHAQPLPRSAGVADAEAGSAPLLPWLAVGVLLAIVAGGAWHLLRRDPPAAAAAAAAAVAAAASSVAAVVAAASSVAASAASSPARANAVPPPTRAGAPAVAPRATPKAAVARRPPPPAPATPAKGVAETASAPSARLPALAELPAGLRQQVPALAIGGSVYSPQATARMVIVNGQVFHEGSSLAPELKLEQIRQKSAVFSISGTRFEVPL